MDVSEEYVKMCWEAEEIQKEFKGKLECGKSMPGACYIHEYGGVHICGGYMDNYNCNRYFAWLPRQDELQPMLGDFDDCMNLIDRYDCISAVVHDFPDVTSMEQLWLAFVMHEKYQKTWDTSTSKWVKKEGAVNG